MFSGGINPLDSQCNRIPYNYSWYDGDDAVHKDNIEIDGLTNSAFEVIDALWIRPIFDSWNRPILDLWIQSVFGTEEENYAQWNDWNGVKTGDMDDWVVTAPLSGPVTMDNICHKDLWWVASNGVFETPEGRQVSVDYGAENEQALILQGLYRSGAENWHPSAFKYVGEFSTLAKLRWQTSDQQIFDYMNEVRKAFDAQATEPCTLSDSIEFFFNGVAPLNMDKETIMGALDAVGLYSDDAQMITIIKAAWYIRTAEENMLLNPAKTQQYVGETRKLLESILCTLPKERPLDEYEMGSILSRIEDEERKAMVWWILQKMYELDRPPKTAQECLEEYLVEANLYGTHIVENGVCVPCEDPTPFTLNGEECINLVYSEQCLAMEPAGTYIINPEKPDLYIEGVKFAWPEEFGAECIPCEEPTPITTDGITCIAKRKKGKTKAKPVVEEVPVKVELPRCSFTQIQAGERGKSCQ